MKISASRERAEKRVQAAVVREVNDFTEMLEQMRRDQAEAQDAPADANQPGSE